MQIYFNTSTGNYYTLDEIRHDYNMFEDEFPDENFSDYLDRLITNGSLEEIDENPFAVVTVDSGLYQAAVNLMDDEIREKIHEDLNPCTEKEFLSAYIHAHKNKYDEEFTF